MIARKIKHPNMQHAAKTNMTGKFEAAKQTLLSFRVSPTTGDDKAERRRAALPIFPAPLVLGALALGTLPSDGEVAEADADADAAVAEAKPAFSSAAFFLQSLAQCPGLPQ